ncbi:MAG: rod shape-determining protein MreC [Chloracidobacterium sp.]|nr:rod shape-determining protein MreC [Chloracidobacterium sp.]MDW8218772.1 rod shape-determining protein MreC [Acidobacteriota bacterium]
MPAVPPPLQKLDPAHRLALFVAGILLAQFLLMSLHARARSLGQSLPRTAVITLLQPLQKATDAVVTGLTAVWTGYIDLRGVYLANQRLQEENARLRLALVEREQEALEGRRLRELLALKQSSPAPTIVANVIGGDGTPWFRQITLDKGSLDGVLLNSPVITPQGVVGRVVAVGPTAAIVQTIADGQAGLGATLAKSRVNGELRGQNQPLCRLENVSGLTEVETGEMVLTSGLDGVYPKGLIIGTVETVERAAGAGVHRILVRPAAPLERLEEVAILPPTVRVTVAEPLRPPAVKSPAK